jgi:hypothetical protein
VCFEGGAFEEGLIGGDSGSLLYLQISSPFMLSTWYQIHQVFFTMFKFIVIIAYGVYGKDLIINKKIKKVS